MGTVPLAFLRFAAVWFFNGSMPQRFGSSLGFLASRFRLEVAIQIQAAVRELRGKLEYLRRSSVLLTACFEFSFPAASWIGASGNGVWGRI